MTQSEEKFCVLVDALIAEVSDRHERVVSFWPVLLNCANVRLIANVIAELNREQYGRNLGTLG